MKILKIDKCYNCPELGNGTYMLYCRRYRMPVLSGDIIDPKCGLPDEKGEFLNILKEEGEK